MFVTKILLFSLSELEMREYPISWIRAWSTQDFILNGKDIMYVFHELNEYER